MSDKDYVCRFYFTAAQGLNAECPGIVGGYKWDTHPAKVMENVLLCVLVFDDGSTATGEYASQSQVKVNDKQARDLAYSNALSRKNQKSDKAEELNS